MVATVNTLISALLFVIVLACAPAPGAQTRIIGGGAAGWNGWKSEGEGWAITDQARGGNPFPKHPHWESIVGGEQKTGRLCSPAFTIKGDLLRFCGNGWDSREGGSGLNCYRLVDADTGKMLRQAEPPGRDSFHTASWLVSDLRGRKVVFQAVDGDKGSAFAWIGLSLLEEDTLAVPSDRSMFRGIRPGRSLGCWSLATFDGFGRKTPPYLSSLAKGESQTGILTSPVFKIDVNEIRLAVRGWTGVNNERGLNSFQLVDADTGELLRKSLPPKSDFATALVWDVEDYVGRNAVIKCVDSDANTSYAWIGLDQVDAGSDMRVDFAENSDIGEWTSQGSEPVFTLKDGLPFIALPFTIVPSDGKVSIPINEKLKRIYLLGMTNTLDQGNGVWVSPLYLRSRFWLGDEVGSVKVTYSDGSCDDYPLVFGSSIFWGARFTENPEPFISNPEAKRALKRSLRLYPAGPPADFQYLAVIAAQDKPVREVLFTDSTDKDGSPVITGITVECADNSCSVGSPLPHNELPRELKDFIETRPLLTRHPSASELEPLRRALYQSEETLKERVPPAIPKGFKGPRVVFKGDVYADILTNAWYANIQDILEKVTSDGMYHTSTKDAPTYGHYEGFGTYKETHGAYYAHCWSRDMGRAMLEITSIGCLDKAKLAADYALEMANKWPDPANRLEYEGRLLPAHWCRIINLHNPREGNFENDGHGLISLFIYKLWQRLPDRDEWLKKRWKDVRKAGDWILWQMENPEISGFKDTLRTDSECSAGIGYSVYADYACIMALEGLAEMAGSLGEEDTSAKWREASRKLRRGIEKAYIIDDDKYGRVWTLTSAGWPNKSTVMGPVILAADRYGFNFQEPNETLRNANKAALDRMIDTYAPRGYYGVAMGYGQGFVTQSALLQDRMDDATEMIRWMARCIYDPRHKPFICPEGCEVDPTGKYWRRTGDLGNGVQEAEIVKVMRIIVGIDDPGWKPLTIAPRIPSGWTGISVRDYPVLTNDGSSGGLTKLAYELTLSERRLSLCVTSERPVGRAAIRLAVSGSSAKVRVNGVVTTPQIARNGDRLWATILCPIGPKATRIEVEN